MVGGGKKFVLGFPPQVLRDFFDSFPVINTLDTSNEVQVYEAYLLHRYDDDRQVHSYLYNHPHVPLLQTSQYFVAVMRLLIAAQWLPCMKMVYEAFLSLPDIYKNVLWEEVARTGVQQSNGMGMMDYASGTPKTE